MKAHRATDALVMFWCPGCDKAHQVSVASGGWSFNGDYERPTFKPSVLVRTGHFIPDHQGPACWCTYNAEHPDDSAPFKCALCHSFVTDGRIQFLGDSTHPLAGQTVELPECEDI